MTSSTMTEPPAGAARLHHADGDHSVVAALQPDWIKSGSDNTHSRP
jgi:hypothetical protein